MFGEMRRSSFARSIILAMISASQGMGASQRMSNTPNVLPDMNRAMHSTRHRGDFIATGQRAHLKAKHKRRRTR